MPPRLDLTGLRFDRLVADHYVRTVKGAAIWLFKCDCGSECEARCNDVKRGKIHSCGCMYQEMRGLQQLKHGQSRKNAETPTYRTWKSVMARTANPNHKDWKHYGGRGITVCERWKTFSNFFEDMGQRPDGMTIDRVDVDGDYEPSNCRWATQTEQVANRRPIIVSQETRDKLSNRFISDETRRKMSASAKRREELKRQQRNPTDQAGEMEKNRDSAA